MRSWLVVVVAAGCGSSEPAKPAAPIDLATACNKIACLDKVRTITSGADGGMKRRHCHEGEVGVDIVAKTWKKPKCNGEDVGPIEAKQFAAIVRAWTQVTIEPFHDTGCGEDDRGWGVLRVELLDGKVVKGTSPSCEGAITVSYDALDAAIEAAIAAANGTKR